MLIASFLVSGILSGMSVYTINNNTFTLLYGLKMSLSNQCLMIDLFLSNNRIAVFLEHKKKFMLQQTREGPFNY